MTENQTEDAGQRFPFVTLEKALFRAEEFYIAAGDRPVIVKDAFEVWRYSKKSSGGNQTISALKMYGVLNDEGMKDSRKLFLTTDGLRYFRDERDEVHAELRRKFALSPKLIRAVWAEWGVSPPADNIARSHLKIDRELSEQSARSLLAIYKENLSFAEITGDDKIPDEDGEIGKGDIPWPPPGSPPQPTIKGVTLMGNERVWSDGILSKEATYRVIVSGKIGPKEIDRLIKKLELDKVILQDVSEPMATEYTHDEEGRKAEERDRKLNEEIEGK